MWRPDAGEKFGSESWVFQIGAAKHNQVSIAASNLVWVLESLAFDLKTSARKEVLCKCGTSRAHLCIAECGEQNSGRFACACCMTLGPQTKPLKTLCATSSQRNTQFVDSIECMLLVVGVLASPSKHMATLGYGFVSCGELFVEKFGQSRRWRLRFDGHR